jgi:hypothetical protein
MRFALAILTTGLATAALARASSASIDDFIATEMPSAGAPGLAYAVVDDGKVVSGAYGEILAGSGKPVTIDTPFATTPVLFVIGIVAAVVGRARLRAKSGVSGAFSLWFPLLATLALAWTSAYLIPRLFGVSLRTFSQYQPDFVVLLVATAAMGVLWAMFRLEAFYSGKLSRHRS